MIGDEAEKRRKALGFSVSLCCVHTAHPGLELKTQTEKSWKSVFTFIPGLQRQNGKLQQAQTQMVSLMLTMVS